MIFPVSEPGGEQRVPAEGDRHPDRDQGGHPLLLPLHGDHETQRLRTGSNTERIRSFP